MVGERILVPYCINRERDESINAQGKQLMNEPNKASSLGLFIEISL